MKQIARTGVTVFAAFSFAAMANAQQTGQGPNTALTFGYSEVVLSQVPFQTEKPNRGPSEDRRAPSVEVAVRTTPVVPLWTEQYYDPMGAIVPANVVPPRIMQTWSMGVFR